MIGLVVPVRCSPGRSLLAWGALAMTAIGCGTDTKITRLEDPPQAFIDGPTSDDVFRLQGPGIPLAGRVSDSYDLPDELVAAWILPDGTQVDVMPDPAGLVALEIPVDDYETGFHTFALFVVDSDGTSGRAEGSFEVQGPLGPPQVQITVPAVDSTFPEGTSITFQGQGSDLTTPPDDLAFEGSSEMMCEF